MIGFPKPSRTRQSLKRSKRRTEARVIQVVRAACVERDGESRMASRGVFFPGLRSEGPSEWAHLPSHARWRTRQMAPESRHVTSGSIMLRRSEHDALDGRTLPRLVIEALSEAGADGPLRYRWNGHTREDHG